ncbi:arsenite efflux transporter metallochaperone ArsD [Aminipila sp.]|uniref:arsenite efflux transporter metallochaperone ArsD n=1 Tax=Aminipila sp. TaxID=2060095 RepID=UPI000EEC36FE|nr:arsenite efflux transporter metallochaperone ArsD [Aminipila sp.]HCX60922.1 arsenical resistance operon transcriptional repressor ArsD [Clostridiales bacterium]
MKKLQIFEPAMCCSTGVCGVGVDPELIRISTTLNTLKKNGIEIDRFNLSNAPQEFLNNKAVNTIINEKGVDELPVTVLEGEVVLTGRYPTNEEIVKMMDIPVSSLSSQPKIVKATKGKSGGCGCSGGDCC